MKPTRTVFTIFFALTFSACVTTHYNAPEVVADGKLDVSCSRPDWLTNQFAAVTCTFENKSDDWIDLEATKVSTEGNRSVMPLTAGQTNSFLTAYQFKKQQSDANTDLVLTSLVIAGLGVAAASENSSTSAVGAAVAIGAAGYDLGRSIDKKIHDAQYPEYGNSHILGPKVQIPAKLFIRRAMIIQAEKKNLEIQSLNICLGAPKVECFAAKIKTPPALTGPNHLSSI